MAAARFIAGDRGSGHRRLAVCSDADGVDPSQAVAAGLTAVYRQLCAQGAVQ